MVSYKQRLKEFRRPDVFQKQAAVWLDEAIKHKTIVLTACGLIVLLMVGLYGYSFWQSHQKDLRQGELAKIEAVYDKEMEAAGKKQSELSTEIKSIEDRLSGLKNPEKLKADSPDAKLSADEKAAAIKDLTAKKASLEASINDFAVDHPESIQKYEDYLTRHSKAAEGWRAGARLAEIYIQKQQFEDAARVMAKILAESGKLYLYNIVLRQSYVGVLEELARYDDAILQLDILIKEGDDELKAKALLSQAKLFWLKNEKDKANETLDKIVNDYEKSAVAGKAKAFRFIWR